MPRLPLAPAPRPAPRRLPYRLVAVLAAAILALPAAGALASTVGLEAPGPIALLEGETEGPTTTIDSAPRELTNDPDATFTFSADDPAATFECRLVEGAWEACESPKSYDDLEDGEHTFEVRATDALGNEGPPARHSWTVDTVAPGVELTDGPEGVITSRSARFEFSSDEEEAVLECRLDTGDWEACSSPHDVEGLDDGDHEFGVRARDAAGNESEPATRAFGVDATAPETKIDSAPPEFTNDPDATFTFSADDPEASFECRLVEGAWEACGSPKSYDDLEDGEHTFEVRATDEAGNVEDPPARHTWTVDTAAPGVTITKGPSGPHGSRTATFEFASEDEDAVLACRLDQGAWTACSSPHVVRELTEGDHVFRVRARDAAGNETEQARAFRVDVTAPRTTLTLDRNAGRFVFSANESGTRFECSLDGAAWRSCTSPQPLPSLSPGDHSFQVRATDAAGNVGPAARVNFRIEPPPPPPSESGSGSDEPPPPPPLVLSANAPVIVSLINVLNVTHRQRLPNRGVQRLLAGSKTVYVAPVPGRVTVRLTLDPKRQPRKKSVRVARTTTIATGSRRFPRAGRGWFKLHLSKVGRRTLTRAPNGSRVVLTMTATFAETGRRPTVVRRDFTVRKPTPPKRKKPAARR
jgi:hypothetical protein